MCQIDRKTNTVTRDCGYCGCLDSRAQHTPAKTPVMVTIGKRTFPVRPCTRCGVWQ